MESLGLIAGHLIGDYIVQNDWMATSAKVSTQLSLNNNVWKNNTRIIDCDKAQVLCLRR